MRALLLSNVNRQMCFENVDIYQYYSYWHKVLQISKLDYMK